LVNRFLAGKRLKSAGELYLADASPAATAAAVTPDQTAGVDDRDLLWRAMADLTERQRAALVLRFFHDLPDDQVADMLDCEMGTVRSLISRGLAILRATGTFADDEVGSYYLRNAR
jgi:RNA polymerase sigma factor (sigma-70 family)